MGEGEAVLGVVTGVDVGVDGGLDTGVSGALFFRTLLYIDIADIIPIDITPKIIRGFFTLFILSEVKFICLRNCYT